MKKGNTMVHLLRKICTSFSSSLNFLGLLFVCLFFKFHYWNFKQKPQNKPQKKSIIKASRKAASLFEPFLAASATLK